MSYKPVDFTVEACGFYDALYGRPSNPYCVPDDKRFRYLLGYSKGAEARLGR